MTPVFGAKLFIFLFVSPAIWVCVHSLIKGVQNYPSDGTEEECVSYGYAYLGIAFITGALIGIVAIFMVLT